MCLSPFNFLSIYRILTNITPWNWHSIDWLKGSWDLLNELCIQYLLYMLWLYIFVCLLWCIYDFNGQLVLCTYIQQNWTTTEQTSISAEKRFSTYWSTPIITPCRCSGIESEPTQKTLHSAQHSISTLYYSQSICHWRWATWSRCSSVVFAWLHHRKTLLPFLR